MYMMLGFGILVEDGGTLIFGFLNIDFIAGFGAKEEGDVRSAGPESGADECSSGIW